MPAKAWNTGAAQAAWRLEEATWRSVQKVQQSKEDLTLGRLRLSREKKCQKRKLDQFGETPITRRLGFEDGEWPAAKRILTLTWKRIVGNVLE